MSFAPAKPTLVFDGDCGFCRSWVDYWRQLTGDRVIFVPYQEAGQLFPQIEPAHFARAVQYVTTEGTTAEGAAAVFAMLANVPKKRWLLWSYVHVPGFSDASEFVYRLVASNRPLAATLTRLCWGHPQKQTFVLSRWVFLRLLGILYFVAFLSALVQLDGLIGAGGVLPATQYFTAIAQHLGASRFFVFPTFAWLNSSNFALDAMAVLGIVASFAIIGDVAVLPSLVAAYALYLSVVVAGQVFFGFQWDALLLEMGFLAILFASWSRSQGFAKQKKPSTAVRWLLWLLLFRLVWDSAMVKLLSGDPTWRNLTALQYHYLTQPLPNPLSRLMYFLPDGYHRLETFISLAVELCIPFLIFTPRRVRFLGAWIIIGFQSILLLTGNYAGYNLQAIALCALLFDDAFYRQWLPARFREASAKAAERVSTAKVWVKRLRAVVIGYLFLANALLIGAMAFWSDAPFLGAALLAPVEPFRIINTYGAFAIMTTTRPEVVIQGSDDGIVWKEYDFRFKPGDVKRPAAFVAPHDPRLDWQMWFLQFGDWRQNPWFFNLMLRLLQGSPDVTAFFDVNPFPTQPPRYVRARVYDYRFATPAEMAADGSWWHRTFLTDYFPITSLQTVQFLFHDDPKTGE